MSNLEDCERKNVGMGGALCSQSAPHKTQSAYQRDGAKRCLFAIA
jgi:hypothetical protein